MTEIERNTREVILDYWQEIANYWRLKDKDWYKKEIAFHRQIWLSCVDIVNASDYEFNTSQATSEVTFKAEEVKQALAKIWFAGGSMVVQGILYHHEGEYSVRHADAISRQFRDIWENLPDEVHFFDYIETIVVDACASQLINITCLRALSDILEISLNDLCLLPNDQHSLN